MVIAFDLDGTLFTSEKILGLSYETAVKSANARWGTSHAVPTTAEILKQVGQPVRKIFLALYPDMLASHREELANDVLADLTARIRRKEGLLYDGVIETLGRLQAEKVPMLLVSNCRRGYLEAVTKTYRLVPFFERMSCNEDAPELGKSGLLKEMLGGRIGVMVGDRASDGEAARHAGVPWIGCDYGYGDALQNELIEADTVIRSFPEVIDAAYSLIKNPA